MENYDSLFLVRKPEGTPEHIVIPTRYEFLCKMRERPDIATFLDSYMARAFNFGTLHLMTFSDIAELQQVLNPENTTKLNLAFYSFGARNMLTTDVIYLVDNEMFGTGLVLNLERAFAPSEKVASVSLVRENFLDFPESEKFT